MAEGYSNPQFRPIPVLCNALLVNDFSVEIGKKNLVNGGGIYQGHLQGSFLGH